MESSLRKAKRSYCGEAKEGKGSSDSELSLDTFFLTTINSLIILDGRFNYLYVNEQKAKRAGIKPIELIGKNIWVTFPKIVGTIFERNVRKAILKKRFFKFEWMSAYGNIIIFNLIPSNEGLLISCELPDRSEEILANSEEKYRYIVKQAPTGICEIDYQDYRFKVVNKSLCETLGFSEQELLSMSLLDILSEEEKNRFKHCIEKKSNQETFENLIEYKIVNKSGLNLWISLELRRIYNNGQRNGLLLVWNDVTNQKKRQVRLEREKKNLKKLVEAQKEQLKKHERLAAIGQTANMVGHDIRNPLQAIVSSTYLMREDARLLQEGPEKKSISEEIKQIENQIEYINKIVQDLQDYGKPLTPAVFETDLEEIIGSIKNYPIPDNIKTIIRISKIPKIRIDPLLFRRSIGNLVSNAIQAMPDGGTLTISAEKKDNELLITIEDNGLGIAEENKPKIFTPLFTTKAKGQGLGLAVVKRLIEAQKGKINFESIEGKGTKFFITIPINES